jgi:hypothetical protein
MLVPGCGGGDPTATDPRKVLVDGFVAGLDGVVIEAEGGTVVDGYEAWLVLSPAGDLVPRHEDRYESIPCEAPLDYFAGLTFSGIPLGKTLGSAGASALDCRGYTDARLRIPNGRWILIDRRDGRVYFRTWKGGVDP